MKTEGELIFVYNADSGIISGALDFAHKLTSPQTYKCNLCKITYGNFAIKAEWREFLRTLDYNLSFLHRNQFRVKFPKLKDYELPIVLKIINQDQKILVYAKEINDQKNLKELIDLIRRKI